MKNRLIFVCPLGLVLSASLTASTASAQSSAATVEGTKKAWSSDTYVPATTPAGAVENAARVLTLPEAAADRVMQCGSLTAVVHAEPSSTSPAVGILIAGDAVKVVKMQKFYHKPSTSWMDEFNSKDEQNTPIWVQVQGGAVSGWVPARVLIDPLVLAGNSESLALARAKANAEKGGQGWSQSKSVVAKGVGSYGGKVKLEKSNYPEADRILAQCNTSVSYGKIGADAFSPLARESVQVKCGKPLKDIDPGLAAKAEETSRIAAMPPESKPEEKSSGVTDLFGKGLKAAGVKNDTADTALKVAALVEQLSKSTPLTSTEERVFGRECLAACIGSSKVLPSDNPTSAYVQWVGSKLAVNSSLPYPAIGNVFIVIDDPKSMNAMAIPGGPIIITTGMLQFLESEDELAVMLGHELAHVEERHGMQKARDAGAEKLGSLLAVAQMEADGQLDAFLKESLATVPQALRDPAVIEVKKQLLTSLDSLVKKVTEAIMESIQKGSNQGFETGADLRGMSLARAAGWDPAAVEKILARFNKENGDYGGANYSTDRLKEAKEVVTLLPKTGPEADKDGARWKKMDASNGK